MKSRELRIGNYVYRDNEVINFSEIDWDYIVNRTFSRTPMELYEPIQLTEEWLVKFGFVKKYQTFEFKGLNIDGTVVHFSFDKWRSEYDIENCDFTEIPAECKHVHTLQNLYFALTGKELILKEYE